MHLAKTIVHAIPAAYGRWSTDGGALLAAAVAYYVAVAFFPTLLILLAGIGVFLQSTDSGQTAQAQLLTAIEEQVSPALRSQVETVLSNVGRKASMGGPIGVLTLLVTAVAIFAQFDAAFDRIWNIPTKSRGIWASIWQILIVRFKAFVMLIGLGAAILAVFICGIALSTIQSAANQVLPMSDWAIWLVQLPITFALNATVFTLIYRLVPKVVVPWQAAIAGGVLAAVVWEIGRQVLAAYVIGQKYSNAYGVVGAFLAIMLWAYYAVSVIFFGAEYAQAFSEGISKPDSNA